MLVSLRVRRDESDDDCGRDVVSGRSIAVDESEDILSGTVCDTRIEW